MKAVLILFLSLSLSCATLAFAARIDGRVVYRGNPLAGMRIRAYADLNPARKSLVAPVVSDAAGLFRLNVAEGFVALYATSEDGRYFAFCGRNPLLAKENEPLWVGLQAVVVTSETTVPYDDKYTAAIEGVASSNGHPLNNVYVSLYLDTAEDLKGQGYRLSAPTVADGFFSFEGLPESRYFLVARKRQNGARVGPLTVGDMLGVYAGNPVDLKAGEMRSIVLPMVIRQPSEQNSGIPDRPGSINLRGRILDDKGHPLAGLHVFAYRNPVIGHHRPAALSPQTGSDGRFSLSFSAAGVYYIGARQIYGDSPAPEEMFGLYEGRADHGLQIKTHNNAAIEIRVAPIDLN